MVFQLLSAGVTDKLSTNKSSRPSDLKERPLCLRPVHPLQTALLGEKRTPEATTVMFHQSEQALEL